MIPIKEYVPPDPPTTIAITDVSLNPAAPLSSVQPTANPILNTALGLGPVALVNVGASLAEGPGVSMVAGALNVFLEWLKNRVWFPQQHTTLVLIILSLTISGVIWLVVQHDSVVKAVEWACGVIVVSHTNYHGTRASGLGVFKSALEEK